MLARLFSFRGKINRVGFAATFSLALFGSVLFVTAASLLAPLLRNAGAVQLAAIVHKAPFFLVGALMFFWPLAALCVKRIRDIGAPVWILPAWFLVSVADSWARDGHTWIVAALNIVITALLFAWPSKTDDFVSLAEPVAPSTT